LPSENSVKRPWGTCACTGACTGTCTGTGAPRRGTADCARRCVGRVAPPPTASPRVELELEARPLLDDADDIEVLLPLSLSRSCAQSSGTGGRFLILALADGEGKGVLVADGGYKT